MDLLQAIKERHSVRSYTDKQIEGQIKDDLLKFIEKCNNESGLNMQLVLNEPNAFDGFMAHYGNFKNVKNYIALVGKKEKLLDEKCGYYGEKVVLYAQTIGLNTCWVALTYKKIKSAFNIADGEKLCLVIPIGYGSTQGVPHKSKTKDAVTEKTEDAPQWFERGVEAALLAPTAVNQQKFKFLLSGNNVKAKAGFAPYSRVDLGIAKYHFEIGAGTENFNWIK